jgi:hypothetical protein
MSAAKSPLDLLSNAQCANERLGALLETISDKLHDALYEMAPGEAREREFYHCWMLLTTAQENHAAIDRKFHGAENGILAAGVSQSIRDHAAKVTAS